MCPTFQATGEEIMSTRGRANAIRAALELRGLSNGDPLCSPEMEAALSNCLSCKACTTECPSNVNLSLLKAELLHARIVRDGLSLRQRVLSSVDLVGRLGCIMPWLAKEKRRLSAQTQSAALRADAAESTLCAYLSLIALAGLAAHALFKIEWADPIAALAILPLILYEARESLRGHPCDCCP